MRATRPSVRVRAGVRVRACAAAWVRACVRARAPGQVRACVGVRVCLGARAHTKAFPVFGLAFSYQGFTGIGFDYAVRAIDSGSSTLPERILAMSFTARS